MLWDVSRAGNVSHRGQHIDTLGSKWTQPEILGGKCFSLCCRSVWFRLDLRAMEKTSAGLLHAGFMLAIAAMVLIAVEAGKVTGPGRDDASAWITSDAAFVLFIGGAIAAFFGIVVMCRVFTLGPSQENTPAD